MQQIRADAEAEVVPRWAVVLDAAGVLSVLAILAALASVDSLLPWVAWTPAAILAVRLWCTSPPRLVAADYGVLLVSVAYGIQLLRPPSGASSLQFAAAFGGIGIYWLMRTAAWKALVQERVFRNVAGGAAIASALAILQSVTWANSMVQAGFHELSPLKTTLPSVLGGPINDWATVALLGVVFTLSCLRIETGSLLQANLIGFLGLSLVSASLFLTFSRGAYISLGIMFALLCALALRRLRESRKVIAIAGVIVILAGVVADIVTRGGVRQSAAMDLTEQQRRSLYSRPEVWKSAIEMSRHQPLLGSGPDTFAMRFVPYAHLSENRPFVGRALNTPLELLVEQGIAGVVAFSFLAIALLRCAARTARQASPTSSFRLAVLCTGLIALLVRELAFSSFLECSLVACLFWLLAAATVNLSENEVARDE